MKTKGKGKGWGYFFAIMAFFLFLYFFRGNLVVHNTLSYCSHGTGNLAVGQYGSTSGGLCATWAEVDKRSS